MIKVDDLINEWSGNGKLIETNIKLQREFIKIARDKSAEDLGDDQERNGAITYSHQKMNLR